MTHIIDRRPNAHDKQMKNRKRFLDLNRKQLREQVKRIVDGGSVDTTKANRRVRVRSTDEPTFRQNHRSGDREYVLPGNKEFVVGDKIQRPPEGNGGGRGQEGSPDGEGFVDFEFVLTREEFRDMLFEELELPDFVKKTLKTIKVNETMQAGFKSEGTPAQLDLKRSAKNALGRRIGLKRPKTDEIRKLEGILAQDHLTDWFRKKIEDELEALKRKQRAVPWIDPFDIQYRDQRKIPKPHTQAVMFCVMDISYSMGEHERDIAKRFFMLLNLFLNTKYNDVRIVFIAHHSRAWECTEDEFFRGNDAGGTVASTATELVEKIIRDRYNPEDWNIYVAQASDGDNYGADNDLVTHSVGNLLKIVQYYAYIEIINPDTYSWRGQYITGLWNTLARMIAAPNLAMQQATKREDVWKVLSNLFHRSKKDDKHVYGSGAK